MVCALSSVCPWFRSSKVSEPRTQRSGVSGMRLPLTPLRCVRGSDTLLERNQGQTDERAQTIPAADGPDPVQGPRSVGAAGNAQPQRTDRVSLEGSSRETP